MLSRRQMIAAGMVLLAPECGSAGQRTAIDAQVNRALGHLWGRVPASRTLSARALAMVVIPNIDAAARPATGQGALLLNDEDEGYEAPAAAYYTLSAGFKGVAPDAPPIHHALYFMAEDALAQFRSEDAWETPDAAQIKMPAPGTTLTITSTLLARPLIGLIYGEKGLLPDARLLGARYSREAD